MKYTGGPITLKFQAHCGANFATEYPFYPTDWTRPYRSEITSGEIENTRNFGAVLAE